MTEKTTSTVLVIIGMQDNASRERVCEILRHVKGVNDVSVSLMRGRAVVNHEPWSDSAALVWAVVKAGYGAALNGTGRRV